MEAGTADRTKLTEKKKMGPPGPYQVAPALGIPCLGPCGPRDMISYLSLDIGDNMAHDTDNVWAEWIGAEKQEGHSEDQIIIGRDANTGERDHQVPKF